MKRKVKIFIVTLIFLLIFPALGNMAFGNNIKVNNQRATDNDIISCIKSFIDLDEEFFGTKKENIIVPGEKTPYFDSDGNIIAYCVELYSKEGKNEIGYVIVGATYDMPPILEAGKGQPPHFLINETKDIVKQRFNNSSISIKDSKILYGGPFSYYAKIDIINHKGQENYYLVNIKSKKLLKENCNLNFLKKPPLSEEFKKNMNKAWQKFTNNNSIILRNGISGVSQVQAQHGPPPGYGYTSVSYPMIMQDIQDQLGGEEEENIYEICGCGPAAGALLLWHLANQSPEFNWNYPPDDTCRLGIAFELCQVDRMNPLAGGTSVLQFRYGLTSFASAHSMQGVSLNWKYSGTSLGPGQNGTNADVWNNLKEGINNKNAVVALGMGYWQLGVPEYPEEDPYIPLNYEYHWVTVYGYIESPNNPVNDMYIKTKSWGSMYYASYNSLCAWRNALASIYINECYHDINYIQWESNIYSHWHSCAFCDYKYAHDLHDWSNWSIIFDSSGHDVGHRRVCNTCGRVDEGGHTYCDWYISKNATCTEPGIEKRYCTICNLSVETRNIPSLGHNWQWVTYSSYKNSSTCPYRRYWEDEKCTRCGTWHWVDRYYDVYEGHEWQWVTYSNYKNSSTCPYRRYWEDEKCTVCGDWHWVDRYYDVYEGHDWYWYTYYSYKNADTCPYRKNWEDEKCSTCGVWHNVDRYYYTYEGHDWGSWIYQYYYYDWYTFEYVYVYKRTCSTCGDYEYMEERY